MEDIIVIERDKNTDILCLELFEIMHAKGILGQGLSISSRMYINGKVGKIHQLVVDITLVHWSGQVGEDDGPGVGEVPGVDEDGGCAGSGSIYFAVAAFIGHEFGLIAKDFIRLLQKKRQSSAIPEDAYIETNITSKGNGKLYSLKYGSYPRVEATVQGNEESYK